MSDECDGCRRGLPLNERGQHWYHTKLVESGVVNLPCTARASIPERDGETLSDTVARLTDALRAISEGVDDPALVAQMALFAKGLVR